MPGKPVKAEKDLITKSSRDDGDGISDAELAEANQLRALRGEDPLEMQD